MKKRKKRGNGEAPPKDKRKEAEGEEIGRGISGRSRRGEELPAPPPPPPPRDCLLPKATPNCRGFCSTPPAPGRLWRAAMASDSIISARSGSGGDRDEFPGSRRGGEGPCRLGDAWRSLPPRQRLKHTRASYKNLFPFPFLILLPPPSLPPS